MKRESRIRKHSDSRDLRKRFFERLELFHAQFGKNSRQAGAISAGPGETFHEPASDRVASHSEHNRNCSREILYRFDSYSVGCKDHIRVELDEFRRDFANPLGFAASP